jgi:hypothetical protein
MPSLSAESLAPFAIATKNGFVEVFVMRVTPMGPAAAEPVAAPDAVARPESAGDELAEFGLALLPLLLHAAKRMAAMPTMARPLLHLPRVDWFTWISSAVPAARA